MPPPTAPQKIALLLKLAARPADNDGSSSLSIPPCMTARVSFSFVRDRVRLPGRTDDARSAASYPHPPLPPCPPIACVGLAGRCASVRISESGLRGSRFRPPLRLVVVYKPHGIARSISCFVGTRTSKRREAAGRDYASRPYQRPRERPSGPAPLSRVVRLPTSRVPVCQGRREAGGLVAFGCPSPQQSNHRPSLSILPTHRGTLARAVIPPPLSPRPPPPPGRGPP